MAELRAVGVETLERAEALAQRHSPTTLRRGVGVALNVDVVDLVSNNPFWESVVFGMRARASMSSIDLLLLANPRSFEDGDAVPYADICRGYGLEGIVLLSFAFHQRELQPLLSSGFPCVAVDLPLIGPRATYVTSDQIHGASLAVRHLIERGRHRIAHIQGTPELEVSGERRFAYFAELERAGLPRTDEYLKTTDWSVEQAVQATLELLALDEPPDAIFASSDQMAIAAMHVIQHADLRVPQDIAVVGFDDIDIARRVVPSLTTVRQDPLGLGAAAVEVIARMIEEPSSPPAAMMLPLELIVRESTMPKHPDAVA